MKRILKPLNKANLGWPIFIFFLFSLFFSVRYTFFTNQAYITGAYSDFTSISLYISDICLFLLLFWLIVSRGRAFRLKKSYFLVLPAWVILAFAVHPPPSSLNTWFFLKTLELLVAYGTLFVLFKESSTFKGAFIKLFVWFCSIESIIGIAQFLKQSSLGFIHRLGEQVIAPNLLGIAKIDVSGIKFIRAYGTFPHPNPFSAFLVVGILLCTYLLFNSTGKYKRVAYSVALFVNITGLILTFSRAGFLAAAVGLIVYFGGIIYLKRSLKPILYPAVVVAFSTLFIAIAAKPFLLTRATVTDSASLERVFYTKLGIQIIKHYPVLGAGIGESVLHMQQFAPFRLETWQIQPVHNYFLLTAAEIGIPGMLILMIFLGWHLFHAAKRSKNDGTTFSLLLTATLIAILVLMQFDHYFYTLQQTQFLLWTLLALTAAQIKSSPERES